MTRLFSRWRGGDEDAAAELLFRVFDELRRLADSEVSKATVERDWKSARVWLYQELAG